jgi:hypothetical protein
MQQLLQQAKAHEQGAGTKQRRQQQQQAPSGRTTL